MALRRGWLWLVLFALLAAQTLGFVHRIVHGPQAALSHAVHAQHSHSHAAGDSGHGLIAPLFSGHGDVSDCRLYDQLGNGQAMPSVPAVLPPLMVPLFVLQFFQGEAVARWAALFDARGPPSVR
jgi:hypothetical protein